MLQIRDRERPKRWLMRKTGAKKLHLAGAMSDGFSPAETGSAIERQQTAVMEL